MTSTLKPGDGDRRMRLSRRLGIRWVLAFALVIAGMAAAGAPPASATLYSWPSGWINPAGSANWEDWNFNQCGYVVVNGQPWAHLGNDSQGYKSGAVRSIGTGVVRRVVNAAAPNNGLMVEYQSTAGPFTLLYQHVNPGASLGATVVAGQQIGTVANWPDPSNNHVHISLIPGTYTASTSWYGYRNCSTGAGGGGGHVNPIPWLAANLPASTGSNPQGTVDDASSPTAGTVNVRGWAFDRDAATSPIGIHVYVGGPAGAAGAEGHDLGPANASRPDVGAAFPGVGNNHGYDKTVATGKTGSQPVYVYAINVGGGGNVLIGQRTVNIADPDPFGNFESLASPAHKRLRVVGWAIDRNAPTAPVGLHAYVGGPAGTPGAEFHDLGTAGLSRPDVAAAYPGTGQNHGFDKTFATSRSGTQAVYLYALNQGAGGNRLLLSRSVAVMVDTAPPDTLIGQIGNDGRAATVHFSADEEGSSFQCSTAGSVWAACISPATTQLAATATSFAVRAVDIAGNVDSTPAQTTLPTAVNVPIVATPVAPPTATPVTPPTTTRAVLARVKVVSHDRVRLNVRPDWRKGNYRVLVQKKGGGRWRAFGRTTTFGPRDIVLLLMPRGAYRVVVTRAGFDPYRSGRLRLRR